MKVMVAEHAGICYGVERALKMALEAAEAAGADAGVHTLGPLIHNPQAVADLRDAGVAVAGSLEEAANGTVVIRSHGVAPAIIADAKAKGLSVVDATCPHVSKAHQAAEELKDGGYAVIIVGEADHPEVEGIMAHAGGEALVVQSAAELPAKLPGKRVGIVVQTTQSVARLSEVVDAVLPNVRELRIFNTICSATALRQRAAEELARQVDVVVVVGGHNSGNTTRLYEICGGVNPRTHHVETADELDADWFVDAKTVGVTAGASTPGKQMRGVIEAIESLGQP